MQGTRVRALAREDPTCRGATKPPVSLLMSRRTDRASLAVQWLRIRLPMRGTRVRALVWEDPTCHGATGPVSHNY
ncbi:hypothetical protein J1605_010343 [Eschrichtius robustus]|uniref:Uncharacterized protein n=1 Tax=Eschrichtius robustus TaxID=9764 RepID=A0AB34GTN4_ESCRO|nr:hypothetical protein J1605_010343 [Eschrichtius robustus]